MMRVATAGAILCAGLLRIDAQTSPGGAMCTDPTSSTAASLMQRPRERNAHHPMKDVGAGLRRDQELRAPSGPTTPAKLFAMGQDEAHVGYTLSGDMSAPVLRSMLSLSLHNEAPKLVIHLLVPESDLEAAEKIGRCFRQQLRDADLRAPMPTVEITSLSTWHPPFKLDYWWSDRLKNAEAVQARLFLHEYLPQVKRILYLDGDTLVLGDVSALFAQHMNTPLMAGIDILTFGQHHNWKCPGELEKQVNVSQMEFNDGVMLMDLDRWRAENITASLVELTQKIPCAASCDQFLVNLEFQQHREGGFDRFDPDWMKLVFAWEIEKDFHDNKILHFVDKKPWGWGQNATHFLELFRSRWASRGSVDLSADCADFVL